MNFKTKPRDRSIPSNYESDKSIKCSKDSKGTNFGEGHMEGTNYCEIEIKERVNEKMPADCRMGSRRVLQILAGEDVSPKSNPRSHPTHFRCKMDPKNKIKLNPWVVEKSLIKEIESTPDTIRSNNESDFVIEISN